MKEERKERTMVMKMKRWSIIRIIDQRVFRTKK